MNKRTSEARPTIYTVYTVRADGNPYPVVTTPSAELAVLALRIEEEKYRGQTNHAHGIYDANNPEDGDINDLDCCIGGCGKEMELEKIGSMCADCVKDEKSTREFEAGQQEWWRQDEQA